MFVMWKLAILGLSLIAPLILPLKGESLGRVFGIGLPYLTWIWANFDGVHYAYIAQNGYQYPNFAFFPLLPLLIHLVKQILSVHAVEAGLLVVHVSLLLSAIALYKIVTLDHSKAVAFGSVAMLFLFPLSFFYGAVYTESLFLLTSLLSFYFARKGEWLKAGIIGYFASATRLVGIALLPALLAEWFIMQKGEKSPKLLVKKFFREKAFLILLIPLGLTSYMVYLQIFYGDFLLLQKSMADWGQAQIVLPAQVLFRYYRILLTVPWNIAYFIAAVELIATILYFLLSVFVLRRVRLSYGVFMLVLLTIPTFTGTLQSMPRYILQLFPAFIGLSVLLLRSRMLFAAVSILALVLQFLFVSMFTRGWFVA